MNIYLKPFLLLFVVAMTVFVSDSMAQGSYWGVQVSPGFSLQKWNNSKRDALLTISGDVFVSQYGSDETNVFYAKLGYHQRGSQFNFRNSFIGNSSLKYVFHNAVLGAGIQKTLKEKIGIPFYYLLGVRVEYTMATNFEQFQSHPTSSAFFANKAFVNRFNYGFDFGGGFVYGISSETDLYLEFVVSPDFSLQYEQAPIYGVLNPYTNRTENLPERLVRNLSFELALGVRFGY